MTLEGDLVSPGPVNDKAGTGPGEKKTAFECEDGLRMAEIEPAEELGAEERCGY